MNGAAIGGFGFESPEAKEAFREAITVLSEGEPEFQLETEEVRAEKAGLFSRLTTLMTDWREK